MKRWLIRILRVSTYKKYKKEFGADFAKKYYKLLLLFLFTNKKKYQLNMWSMSKDFIKSNYIDSLIIKNSTLPIMQRGYKTFFFWYQGINKKTPKTILLCLATIKKNAPNVTVIDKNNYKEYVDLPKHIIGKFNAGDIDITHFSDILRVYILAKHGGVWLDATMILNKQLESFVGVPYWTIKHNGCPNSIFAMASAPNNPLFISLEQFYEKYYFDHSAIIDYFLLDQAISLISDNNRIISEMLSKVPDNNSMALYVFKRFFYKRYNSEKFNNAVKETYIYKITYKRPKVFNLIPKTLYKSLIKEFNIKRWQS